MSKQNIIRIAVILIVLGVVCVMGFILFAPAIQNVYVQLTASAEEPGGQFMAALQSGDYLQAYSVCDGILQAELGSGEALGEIIPRVQSWTMQSEQITTNTNENGVRLSGDVIYYNGAASTYELVMLYKDGVYRVSGFQFFGVENAAVLPGEAFMQALGQADHAGAFAMMDSYLQEDMGSVEYLEMVFPKMESWTMEAKMITTNSSDPGVGLSGMVTFYNGEESEYELILVLVNGEYQVGGFDFPSLFMPAIPAGEAFLQALKDDDYQAAYDLFASNLTAEVTGPEMLMEIIPPEIEFGDWDMSWEQVTLNDGAESVVLNGILTLGDGSEAVYYLVMVLEEGEYLLAGYSFEGR